MPSKLLPFHPIFRPIFSGVFPHKLKYQFFGAPILQRRLLLTRVREINPVALGMGKFSTRSGRERMGSGQDMKGGGSKSLIDDEADLSDWVSGLNSGSFMKTRVYSDSESDQNDGGNDRFKGGGERGGERGGKRRRESEGDRDFGSTSRRGGGARGSGSFGSRGGGRGSSEPFSGRGRNENGSNGGSFGGRGGGRDSSGFRGGGRLNDSNGSSFGGRGRGRDSGFRSGGRLNDSNGSSFGGRGRGRDSGSFGRGGKFGGSLDERRKSNDGFTSRGNEGRRENRLSDGNGRGGRGGVQGGLVREDKGTARRGLVITDDDDDDEEEEEQGRGYTNFKELIDSDEAEDDSEEDEDEEEEDEEGADVLSEKRTVLSQSSKSSPEESGSYLSESRFDQCSISPLSLKGIKDAGYEKMTLVQEATLPVILKGKDVLAKAKTGTGKTVAFLLPAIELVVKSDQIARDQKRPPILVLVICPTRELATQAASEANKLLKYHASIGVQVVIGGTRLALEQKRMQANPCQILVATPGRLRDHIENTAGFATRLMGVKVLVLDEADHLLDMGFRKEIEKIIAAVPKQRQTLLFSATVPQEVRQICHVALKRDHEFINTVQEGSEDTHAQVRQTHLIAPLDKQFSLLYTLLKEHIADDVNYKILVFCTTAMVTRLVADLLNQLNLNVREIHSRKPQSYRTRISDEFRKSKGLILVTSDVSARGVDYPDVTLVIQIGVPADRQQYIHRLGRTGRKGKEGQGILMLAPWEEFFLSTVKDLPISKASEPLVDPDTRKKVEHALSQVEMKNKEAAYQAWLGYYNSNKGVGRDKQRLVELVNEFSRSMGLDNPPAIPKLVLGKMGLKNVPGLRSK
ncbi:hypothetical protein BUALT_Bualt01G0238600 [Buddleja alternifolia]|uniref:ATP-dependent RNA helicase n=1 Tax=Buddleja alternifolia TaxID=168488 RepID=A0AAV6YAR6_9LAMI|nr:hypothetical protein BUALT_Bualt01G0238600 [Buddleja alternifolia]